MKPVFTEWSESDYNELEDNREPFRTRILRKGIGIIEKDQYEDHVDIWCPMCKAAGFQVKLGPKIIMPGQTRAPDADQFLECPDCREVVAAYVVEHDATIIRDDIETVDNPFESNQSEIIGANARRTTKAGQRAAARRRNRPTHKDKDIQRELDRHGSDRVHIIQD